MREFIAFLRRVCGLLMACGCSSNRVELLTQILGESWGFEVETLAIPTGVWISVRKGGTSMVELTRVRSWSVDLDRLAHLNDLVDQVHDHKLSLDQAHQRLDVINTAPPPYGPVLTLLAGGGASPVLIYAYGGTTLEVALGLPIGMMVQALSKYLFGESENRRYLADSLSAAAVAFYAQGCHAFFPAVDVPRLIVGGLIVLFPGLVFVNAVHEVAQKNLVSGAAKLLEAVMITISLVCGVVFSLGVVHAFHSFGVF